MIVWGVDPDSKNITIGISRDGAVSYEILSGGKGRRAENRLGELWGAFNNYLDRIGGPHQPHYVYIEPPVYTGNPQATIAQATVLGILRGALMERLIPHTIVDNTVWKKALLGTGRATKEEIRAWAVARYGLPDDLAQDVYDAVAIATWGSQQLGAQAA